MGLEVVGVYGICIIVFVFAKDIKDGVILYGHIKHAVGLFSPNALPLTVTLGLLLPVYQTLELPSIVKDPEERLVYVIGAW